MKRKVWITRDKDTAIDLVLFWEEDKMPEKQIFRKERVAFGSPYDAIARLCPETFESIYQFLPGKGTRTLFEITVKETEENENSDNKE